MLKPLILIVCR